MDAKSLPVTKSLKMLAASILLHTGITTRWSPLLIPYWTENLQTRVEFTPANKTRDIWRLLLARAESIRLRAEHTCAPNARVNTRQGLQGVRVRMTHTDWPPSCTASLPPTRIPPSPHSSWPHSGTRWHWNPRLKKMHFLTLSNWWPKRGLLHGALARNFIDWGIGTVVVIV